MKRLVPFYKLFLMCIISSACIQAGEKIALFDVDEVLLVRNSRKSVWESSSLFLSLAWNAPLQLFSGLKFQLLHGKEIKELVKQASKQHTDIGIIEALAASTNPIGTFLSTKLPSYNNKTIAEILVDEYIAAGTPIEGTKNLVESLKNNGYQIGYATNMSSKAFEKVFAKELLPEKDFIVAATSTGIKKRGEKSFVLYDSIAKKAYEFQKEQDQAKKVSLQKLDEEAAYFQNLGAALKKALKNKTIDQVIFVDNKIENLAEHKRHILANALGINESKVHFIQFKPETGILGVEQEIKKLEE